MVKTEQSNIVIYRAEDGQTQIEVNLEKDTVWLNQAQLVNLFEKDKRTISEHVNNIFREKELSKSTTVQNFRTVQKEGNRKIEREIVHYNLDLIIR